MDVTKLTVSQLKEELKKHNLKVTGTKQELTDRLLNSTGGPPVISLPPATAPATAPASLPIPVQVQGTPLILKPHVPVTLAGPNIIVPPKPASAPASTSAGKYAGMTVTQLKEELKAKGLKVSGTKAELITRLEGEASPPIRTPTVPTMPNTAEIGSPAVIPPPTQSPPVSAAEYGKMTVAQLREELRDLNIKVSGTKPELIQRLLDHHSGKSVPSGRRGSPSGSPLSIEALGLKLVPKGDEGDSSSDEDIPEEPEGESSEVSDGKEEEEEEEEEEEDDD